MPLAIHTALPSLEGVDTWYNGLPLAKNDLPILVYFWAMSCPACKQNMPALRLLTAEFAPQGLQGISVHAPRGPFDLDKAEVAEAVKQLNITDVCAVDSEHVLMQRFQVQAFPTYFLFDHAHRLKRHASGEFGLNMIRSALGRLFAPPS